MALGRKDFSVARTDSGADILRLAGLLGDDNLVRHQGLVSRIGSESVALRTYSELTSFARDLSVVVLSEANRFLWPGPTCSRHGRETPRASLTGSCPMRFSRKSGRNS